MLIHRKTRKSIEISTIEELIPLCRKISSEFRGFTGITKPLFENLLKSDWASPSELKTEIRNILGISRGTRQLDYYTNYLGWTDEDLKNKKEYYSDRSIKRNSINNFRETTSFCFEYWVKKYGEDLGKQLYSERQSVSSKCRIYQSSSEKTISTRSYIYWKNKGHSEKEARDIVSRIQKRCSPRNLEYWVNKGYSETEAVILRSKFQISCFTKNKKMKGFSNISQKLFSSLPKDENTFFATFPNEKANFTEMFGYEYQIWLDDGSTFFLDYVNIKTRKIIEFDGYYWHKDSNKDRVRDEKLKRAGYSILRIKEKEYQTNQKGEEQKCQQFLNQ